MRLRLSRSRRARAEPLPQRPGPGGNPRHDIPARAGDEFRGPGVLADRRRPRARALADETVRLATENGFSFLRLTGLMVRGARDVEDGRVARGLTDVRTAFEEYRATGQRYNTTYYSALLVRATFQPERSPTPTTWWTAPSPSLSRRRATLRARAPAPEGGVSPRRRGHGRDQGGRDAPPRAGDHRRGGAGRVCSSRCAPRSRSAGSRRRRQRLARLVARFAPEDDCADLRRAREMLDGRDAVARLS